MLLMRYEEINPHRATTLRSQNHENNNVIEDLLETTKKKLQLAQQYHENYQQTVPNKSTNKDAPQAVLSAATSQKNPSKIKPGRRLHAVTYASHHGKDDRFCRAVESAIRHHYELVILGWRVPWLGLSQKLEAAYQYSCSLPDDDIMLFTDAFDVLYTEEAEKIITIFQERNYSILFSAECGCWPHIMDDPPACFKKYPQSPTPYRYLNSGAWMGTIKHIRPMLQQIIRLAGNDFRNANDQKLVADMFISKQYPIALDYMSEIFQSMHSTDPPDLPSCHPRNDMQLDVKERKWRNERTHTTPAIFHFNGGGKTHHLSMEEKVWYKDEQYYEGSKLQELSDYQIAIPIEKDHHRMMTYQEMCGDSYLKHQKKLQ